MILLLFFCLICSSTFFQTVAEGLNWNWSIWKKRFRTFIPILDFIHALQYVFAAAMNLGLPEADAWEMYVRFVTWCWQGRVKAVIEELTAACADRDIDLEAGVPQGDLHEPLTDAIRYLQNNRTRMDYPRYRRLGLPVTSAPMESLIKQIGQRVKGTEMFWDDPHGAEAILHIRAAVLCDDNRLDDYLRLRPGCPFVRRSTQPAIAA